VTTTPHVTEMIETGVPIRPIAIGITYGTWKKKHSGVSITANVSFGENLKYKRNIIRNRMTTANIHGRDNSYRCPIINSALINTMKFFGIIEHNKAAINTIGKDVSDDWYPILELLASNATNDNTNFQP
jgi:hypothetical protein